MRMIYRIREENPCGRCYEEYGVFETREKAIDSICERLHIGGCFRDDLEYGDGRLDFGSRIYSAVLAVEEDF
jgi:hypothetical protein